MRHAITAVRSRLWAFCRLVLFALLALGSGEITAAPAPESTPPAKIEVFVRDGCLHCDAAKTFLDELARERPGLRVSLVDIRRDPQGLARLHELARNAGIAQPGVPTIRIGTGLIVGFDSAATTGVQIRTLLDGALTPHAGGVASACGISDEVACAAPRQETVEIPLIGRQVGVEDIGLPLFTIVLGLLDGFNPCSMWVLLLMISMLATLGDRRKMLAIAGAFVAVEGIAYFAFMAAWLNLFMLAGLSRFSEIAIALLALVAGAINLKDFVAFGRGVSLSIPAAAKPGIYARLRAILRAERLWPALAGTVVLALLVQIVELLCTSGFPALYTRILTLRQLDQATYYGYLLLYNLMYMLDDVVVLSIGVVTLGRRRLQEKEGRLLKLIAGLVMLGLGIYLLGSGDARLTQVLSDRPKVLPEDVCLIGVRSFESGEAALLQSLGVKIYFMEEVRRRGLGEIFRAAVAHVSAHTAGYGISLDMDMLDPAEDPGVGSPVPDGLHRRELVAALESVHADTELLALEVVEYNPHRDSNDETAQAVCALCKSMLG